MQRSGRCFVQSNSSARALHRPETGRCSPCPRDRHGLRTTALAGLKPCGLGVAGADGLNFDYFPGDRKNDLGHFLQAGLQLAKEFVRRTDSHRLEQRLPGRVRWIRPHIVVGSACRNCSASLMQTFSFITVLPSAGAHLPDGSCSSSWRACWRLRSCWSMCAFCSIAS